MTVDTKPFIVYQPSREAIEQTHLADYIRWLARRPDDPSLDIGDYDGLYQWSIDQPVAFWDSLWDYFDLIGDKGNGEVLDTRTMPGAKWFTGASLNYAENLLREASQGDPHRTAIVSLSEARDPVRLTYGELWAEVGAFQAFLIGKYLSFPDYV